MEQKRRYTRHKPGDSARVKARKRQLLQYRSLMREVEEDRARLRELQAHMAEREQREANGEKEEGLAHRVRHEAWVETYRERIRENMKQSYESAVAIQSYINLIEDSEMRRLFTMYYIKGYTWHRIAHEMGCIDESIPRKKHDRYLIYYEGRREAEEKEK